ncbi:MAG TPA: hypothetical protein P5235_08150, partial [Saprospiraceae bacterium]|nr:hypothetical protein [Saprospiraceae bacterium]
HLFFTFQDINDHYDKLVLKTETTPQSNRIIGTELGWGFWNKKILIKAELMASLFTRDNSIIASNDTEFSRNAIPLNTLYSNINNSSSFDIAYTFSSDIKITNSTVIKAEYENVGSNYHTLGNPTLLRNLVRWKADLRQSLFKNQIYINAFIKSDNIVGLPQFNLSTNTLKTLGIDIGLRIKNIPQLQISYMPYTQNSKGLNLNESYLSDSHILNSTLSYPYSISINLHGFTQISLLNQSLKSNYNSLNHDFNMYGLTQSIMYNNTSFNVSMQYTPKQIIGDEQQKVFTFNSTINIAILKSMSSTLGLQWLNISNKENKKGYFGNLQYLITKNLRAELRIQKNMFKSNQEKIQAFDETFGNLALNIKW